MEAILFYLGKMILTSGLMFLYYQLFLKDKTFHHYNRFYLLGTLLVSLFLPLLKVSYFTIEVNNDIYLLINKLQPANASPSNKSTTLYPFMVTIVLTLVSVFFISRFAYGIFKIVKLKKRFPKEAFEGLNFYRTDLEHAPFSYFRNLFWRNNIPVHSDLGRQIMKHEMAHIDQKHTYDKLLIEAVKAVFWFNPFFHLIKKEVHLIHEYLADHKAIKKSDTKAFAQMLLASHFSGNTLPAASPFLNTHLKKRLQMIKTSKTKFSYARKTLALPLLFSIAFACVVHAQNSEIKAANSEIARAVHQIETTTVTTKSDLVINTDERKDRSKASEPSASMLKQSELKVSDLDQQMQELEQTLETLDPVSEAAAVKHEQIAALSKKISDIVNSENFKNKISELRNNVVHYTNVFSKEELEAIKREAARAKAEGAAALEEAKIAIKEAVLASEAAALMQEEAAQAKAAAQVARKAAALAREQAREMKAQAKDR